MARGWSPLCRLPAPVRVAWPAMLAVIVVLGGVACGAGTTARPGSPGLRYFTYTADVRFGKRGHLKTYKSVNELDLLPDGNAPIVSFMGVKDGNTAMFFVADPAYSADGEGSCQPTPQNCMFIFLKTDGAHNEETVTLVLEIA